MQLWSRKKNEKEEKIVKRERKKNEIEEKFIKREKIFMKREKISSMN